MREVTEATSPEAALALLAETRGAVRIRRHGDRTAVRLVHRTVGLVSIDQLTFGMDFDADMGPADRLVLGQVTAGSLGIRRNGVEQWHTPGDVYLAAEPPHHRTALARGGQHEQAIIPPALISQVAAVEPGPGQLRVRFTGYQPVSAQAAQQWKNAYAYVCDTVLAHPDLAAQPLIGPSAARLLAATALATFPNDALADPTREDRHDAHPATLRRATAFISENADTDITVADIAAAARVTIRAVQLAFRRHLDTTPMDYLRRVRLDHAHHDLSVASPGDGLTVTAVAYRWGFASSSRFAALYRRAYGVSPRDTLRQD